MFEAGGLPEDVFATNSIIMDLCAPFLGIDEKIATVTAKLDATAHLYVSHTVYKQCTLNMRHGDDTRSELLND